MGIEHPESKYQNSNELRFSALSVCAVPVIFLVFYSSLAFAQNQQRIQKIVAHLLVECIFFVYLRDRCRHHWQQFKIAAN